MAAASCCTNGARRGRSVLVRGLSAGYDIGRCCSICDMTSARARSSRSSVRTVRQEHVRRRSAAWSKPTGGAVVIDGRHHSRSPNEIAALGISQMPGGQGVSGAHGRREPATRGLDETVAIPRRRDSHGRGLREFPCCVSAATSRAADMSRAAADARAGNGTSARPECC